MFIKFTDSIGGTGEKDAIKNFNARKKKFVQGNDASKTGNADAEPESSTTQPQPENLPTTRISGSDNAETTPDNSPGLGLDQADLPDDQLLVSKPELSRIVQAGVDARMAQYNVKLQESQQTIEELQRELAEEAQRRERDASEYEKKLLAEQKRRESLASVFTDFGYAPQEESSDRYNGQSFIATQSTRGGISPRDALREYKNLYDSITGKNTRSVISHDSGLQYLQRDTTNLDRFFKENRKVLRQAMDNLARDAGVFQGGYGVYNKDAPTTFENFPVVLREYLSQVVRMEHSAAFVLWQAVNRNVRVGVPPNQTTDIPRVKHLTTGTTSADWRLTPGVPTTTDRQNLVGGNISLRIHEYGMGNVVAPVALADIVSQTNILDLESILQERISYNYHYWEDLKIFELLLSSTRIVYSANEGVVDTPAEVTAGSGGQITLNFLGSLRAMMSGVPTLDNGCLMFFGNSYHIAQLEADIERRTRYVDRTSVEDLANMLARKTKQDYSGRISGYKFKVRGFEVFEGTSFSNGIVGTPGVQLETLGGQSVVTRSSFAMGVDAIGWGTSLPMELRTDPQNFQRIQSIIWKSHEEATGLDIDPNRTLLPWELPRPADAEEQLRVYQIRASQTLI